MQIEISNPGDYHVHLRDGQLMENVVPTVREGGISIAYVMPNLVPPITTVKAALDYHKRITAIDSKTTYLMSLYLHKDITKEVIIEAKKTGIIYGVKCYPAGVTTNSDSGFSSLDEFDEIFKEMEKQDMILNIHGECPSTNDGSIHIMNAESNFLPNLEKLHKKFPKLRIILEHCTTKAAIDAVKRCSVDDNDITVCGTITAHHLYLTVDNWGGNSVNFCKPVPKLPSDRNALIEAAISGDKRFFFGSDSAPHKKSAKDKAIGAPAGVFTQSEALPYIAQIFEKYDKLDKLQGFVADFGRQFYKVPIKDNKVVVLKHKKHTIPLTIGEGENKVIPFLSGTEINWSVEWLK